MIINRNVSAPVNRSVYCLSGAGFVSHGLWEFLPCLYANAILYFMDPWRDSRGSHSSDVLT